MPDCIFCKIIKGEAPASIVFEDEVVIVIEPIDPISKGHVLVIPKAHFVNMLDTDDENLSYIVTAARNVGKSLLGKHGASAMNLLHAAGKDAQQSVFHCHFHVVPRYENDGLDLWFRSNL